MTSPEKFKDNILHSLELSLKYTNTKDLEELDRKLSQIKKEDFNNFLDDAISDLVGDERERVKTFLSTRRSYLDMAKEEKSSLR